MGWMLRMLRACFAIAIGLVSRELRSVSQSDCPPECQVPM